MTKRKGWKRVGEYEVLSRADLDALPLGSVRRFVIDGLPLALGKVGEDKWEFFARGRIKTERLADRPSAEQVRRGKDAG